MRKNTDRISTDTANGIPERSGKVRLSLCTSSTISWSRRRFDLARERGAASSDAVQAIKFHALSPPKNVNAFCLTRERDNEFAQRDVGAEFAATCLSSAFAAFNMTATHHSVGP
jgi:hypothetical protein